MQAMPWPGAVAVSGGGDSLALMHLLARWAKSQNAPAPFVLIVDHGLRKTSARDAKRAAGWAKALGLPAHVLTWKGRKPKGDIEAAAREARYGLMGDWARTNGIGALYLGHTRDDQAETFLLRLARGSGLDGLSAMRALAPYPLEGFESLRLVRPLLNEARDCLRDYLKALKQDWLDDPMNADPRFARVRLRAIRPMLEEAGLSAQRIADAAAHLSRARAALDEMTASVVTRACRLEKDFALVDAAMLAAAPHEIGLRALAGILMSVSGAQYRPRFTRLNFLFDRVRAGELGGGATLGGCRIGPAPKRQAVFGPATLLIRTETRL
jgi:tRNA(Ile)-lysidine synthase